MRRLLLAAGLCFACHAGAPETVPGGGLPDGGHALPAPGFAAAWQVSDPRELIAGPSTGGRKGDFEIANARVRFVIEDARPSDGYDPYGCSIAAADRQRDPVAAGESRFGELWLGFNFRAPDCAAISVVNDGSDGQPAVIRATGHDAESPFMASLFAATPAPLHATFYREYTLAPDSDALLFNLTLQNDGAAALDITAPYVGMAMNRGLRHWIDKSGFDFNPTYDATVRLNTSASFYAAVGEHISYSLLNLRDPFSPIINFAHVLIGQYPQLHIPAGQAQTMHFALAVGTGDTGSLQVAHGALVANPDPLVSGLVTDAAGAPVSGARVHLTDSTGTQAVSFGRTASDGSFATRVPSGSYSVFAIADDRTPSPAQTVVVPASGPSSGPSTVRLRLGAQSSILAAATDSAGGPLPAKIVLEPTGTVRPNLPTALGEPWDRQPIVVFSADGTASVPVFPGTWHLTFSRGFEYDRPTQDVTAPAGGSVAARQRLTRVVDSTNWLSGDFHIHAQYSPDGDDLLSLKVRAFAGEGVEIPVSTEHEFIGDFGPTARALLLAPFMHTIAGTELTTTATGHFNIFPLLPVPGALNAGGFAWYNRTIPQVIAEARTRLTPGGEAPIVQLNHPRATGMAYLDAVHFDPASFQAQIDLPDFMTTWDTMEVWNGTPMVSFEGCMGVAGCSQPSHPTAFDWFSFLDRAKRITATGNSDSHNASVHEVGYPRNFLWVGTDDPAQVTDQQVTDALRAGRVTISGGPLLTLAAPAAGIGAPDTSIGGTVKPDFTTGSPVLHLTVTVQAPPWMGKLQRIDLWTGDTTTLGAHLAIASIDLSGLPATQTLRYRQTVDIPIAPAVDNWILATVRGVTDAQGNSQALWPVVQGQVPPYAITNPIWIEVDGLPGITPLKSP